MTVSTTATRKALGMPRVRPVGPNQLIVGGIPLTCWFSKISSDTNRNRFRVAKVVMIGAILP